jgi:hypothetical protein
MGRDCATTRAGGALGSPVNGTVDLGDSTVGTGDLDANPQSLEQEVDEVGVAYDVLGRGT